MKIRHNIPLLLAFSLCLLFGSSPKLVSTYFRFISSGEVQILGNMEEFASEKNVSQDQKLVETYRFAIPKPTPESIGLGTFLGAYSVRCNVGNESLLIGQSSSGNLQAVLNNFVLISNIPDGCQYLTVEVSGPKNAFRLISKDSPVTAGATVTLEKIKWLIEFCSVSVPIFLGIIFFLLISLYSLTNVFKRDLKHDLIKFALWSYSFYFIFQSGLLAKMTTQNFPIHLSNKLGTASAVFALTMIVASVVVSGIKTKLFSKSLTVVAFGLFISSLTFFVNSHGLFLVISYGVTGSIVLSYGLMKRQLTSLMLGTVLLLDISKVIGISTPFMSRTSWFFVSFVLLADAFIRLYGMSRIFSFFREIDIIPSQHSEGTFGNVTVLEKLLKRSFDFSFVTLTIIENGTRKHIYSSASQAEETSTAGNCSSNFSFSLGSQYFVRMQLGVAPLLRSELPSADTLRSAFQMELSSRLPNCLLGILSQSVRDFEMALERSTNCFEFERYDHSVGFNEFMKIVAENVGVRVAVGMYDPTNHQIKIISIVGFLESVAERWTEGFLQARPDNLYGPLARGIHDGSVYIVPDVSLILPYLHENTAEFYKISNTRSCVAIPFYDGAGGEEVVGVIYLESSNSSFSEVYRPVLEKLARIVESVQERYNVKAALAKATNTLSRFIPRTHVFSLISGVDIMEQDSGYLMMLDLKGSTKFSLEHGSSDWLERVEILQQIIIPHIERCGARLQTFSWDAAFITFSTPVPSLDTLRSVVELCTIMTNEIEHWALGNLKLREFWGPGKQKARFCITFGDISRGLAPGTTETWTVTGESMAVIAKMESQCKQLPGVVFTDQAAAAELTGLGFKGTGHDIRGLTRKILSDFQSWDSVLSSSNESRKAS